MNSVRYIGLIIRAAIGCFIQFPAVAIITIVARAKDGIEIPIGTIDPEEISTDDPRIMRIEIEEPIRQRIIDESRAGKLIIIGFDAAEASIPRIIPAQIIVNGIEIPAGIDTRKSSGPTPTLDEPGKPEVTPQELAQPAMAAGRAI